MKAAKNALVKTEAAIQMDLPTFRPPISLDRTCFVVKSLKTLVHKEETRRQSCWRKFMMELESLHDRVAGDKKAQKMQDERIARQGYGTAIWIGEGGRHTILRRHLLVLCQ
jgi:hypothetical protein